MDWGQGPSALGKKLSRACALAVLVQVEHVYTAKIVVLKGLQGVLGYGNNVPIIIDYTLNPKPQP